MIPFSCIVSTGYSKIFSKRIVQAVACYGRISERQVAVTTVLLAAVRVEESVATWEYSIFFSRK